MGPFATEGDFSVVAPPGATLDLYDMNGQMLYTMANVPTNEKLNFNLKQGVYLVNLLSNRSCITEKLLVY